MATYKSYAECKISHPDSEIVTTGKNWIYDKELIGTFQPRVTEGCSHAINDYSWVICNPADHCSSLKEFLGAGFKLTKGDHLINVWGDVGVAAGIADDNLPDGCDHKRFILSAAELNGDCKIPAKAEQWTIYNNTMPLCELTDEQVGKLVKNSGCVEHTNPNSGEWGATISPMWNRAGVYRIKPKSERELFIDLATEIASDECETERIKESIDAFIVKLFDSGKFKRVIKDGE